MASKPKQLTTRKQREAGEALLDYIRRSGRRAGDQLESFPAIARSLGVSVTLLQKVVRSLERDGILAVVPRVGTFVQKMPGAAVPPSEGRETFSRSLSPAPAGSGKTLIRLFVAESGTWARQCWRRIVSAFEKKHPGIWVEFSMSAEEMGPVAGADVAVLEIGADQIASAKLIERTDVNAEDWAELLDPLADMMASRAGTRIRPVMFGTTILFANRKLLGEAGLFEPEEWSTPMGVADTCERYFERAPAGANGVLGWALHDLWAPLLYLGFARQSLDDVRGEVERYVRLVATCPPPRLVTLADARLADFLVTVLREGKTLFVTGYTYHNAFVDRDTWVALPPPIRPGGVPPLGAMAVGVREGAAHPEAGAALARFLAGPTAQGIIAAAGGSLPASKAAARDHVLYPIYEAQIAHGWLRESLDPPAFRGSQAMQVLQSLTEVRTRGLDPDEAVRRLFSYPAGSEFTEVWPARRRAARADRKTIGSEV